MQSIHLKRGLMAGAVIGAAVAALLVFSFLNDRSSDVGVVEKLFLAGFLSSVAAMIAGAIAFVVSRFEMGRRSAWFASGVCLLISVVGGGQAPTWAERLNPGVHALVWVIAWPLAFGSSLWTELRWTLGEAVVDLVRRPSAAAVPPPPSPFPPPPSRGGLAPSPQPPRR